MKSLSIFSGKSWCLDSRLPDLICFDVVVDTLKSSKAFKEFVRLVRVVEMREVFPLNMEALQGLLNMGRWKDSEVECTTFSNQRSSKSSSLPSSREWPRTASISSSS